MKDTADTAIRPPLAQAQLDAWRLLEQAATPGPWKNGSNPCHWDSPEVTGRTFAYYVPKDADAAFIASAREAVPALLAEIQLLREQLAAREDR